jgi:glycosyltransferase involved in cell wall biosynthesis
VIPTHNRPELLVRAVETVLGQDYAGEVECLVVFDQARPAPVCVKPGPRRALRTLANHLTPGLAGARNAGALAASGELLGSCGICVCRGRRRFDRLPPPRVTFRDLLRSRQMAVNPATILVERARFLGDIGPVDEEIPGSYSEDYEWLLRATRSHDVLVIQEPLVRINWHGSSYFARDWETIAAAQRYVLAKYPDFASEPAGLARITGQVSLALAAAGKRAVACRWAGRTLRLNPGQPRAYLALLVAAGVVRAETLLRMANAFGRGL